MLLNSEMDDVNARRRCSGDTPLSIAVRLGHEDVVWKLLEHQDIDANSSNQEGQTPLVSAISSGHAGIAKAILNSERADVYAKDAKERTALRVFVEQGNADMVRIIPQDNNRADVNVGSNLGQSPLFAAAGRGHTPVVKLLLETGKGDVNLSDALVDLTIPLTLAIRSGPTATATMLLESDEIRLDMRDGYGSTPLAIAAEHGLTSMVATLLRTGKVNINTQDRKRLMALSLAIEEGHQKTADLLRSNGATEIEDLAAASSPESFEPSEMSDSSEDSESPEDFENSSRVCNRSIGNLKQKYHCNSEEA